MDTPNLSEKDIKVLIPALTIYFAITNQFLKCEIGRENDKIWKNSWDETNYQRKIKITKKWKNSSPFMHTFSNPNSLVLLFRIEENLVALIVYSSIRRVVASISEELPLSVVATVKWGRLFWNNDWTRSHSVLKTALRHKIVEGTILT